VGDRRHHFSSPDRRKIGKQGCDNLATDISKRIAIEKKETERCGGIAARIL